MAKRKDKRQKPEEMLFLSGLFIGLGVGFIVGNIVAGVLIGMGAGFLAAFAYTTSNKKK